MNNQLTVNKSTKLCSKCQTEKPLSEFPTRKNSKDGFCGQCKKCSLDRSRQTSLKNKEKLLQEHIKFKKEHPIEEKQCYKCKEVKLVSEFYKDKHKRDGLTGRCKKCSKQYNLEHEDEIKLYQKQWNLEHIEENKIYHKQYKFNHKDEQKKWVKNNPEKVKKSKRKWVKNNPDYHKQYSKQWYQDNKNKIRVQHRKYQRHRRKTNPSVRLICNMRARQKRALKAQGVKASLHTIELLGYTALKYQAHIYSLLIEEMTKENNGERKWIQHHLKKLSSFDLRKIEEQKKAFNYTNVIPMWEDDHNVLHGSDLEKKNKIIKKYNLEKYY